MKFAGLALLWTVLSGASAKLNGFLMLVAIRKISTGNTKNLPEQALLTLRQVKELTIRIHYLRRITSVNTMPEPFVIHTILHTQTDSLVPNWQGTSSPTVVVDLLMERHFQELWISSITQTDLHAMASLMALVNWIRDLSNTYYATTKRYPVIYTTCD